MKSPILADAGLTQECFFALSTAQKPSDTAPLPHSAVRQRHSALALVVSAVVRAALLVASNLLALNMMSCS